MTTRASGRAPEFNLANALHARDKSGKLTTLLTCFRNPSSGRFLSKIEIKRGGGGERWNRTEYREKENPVSKYACEWIRSSGWENFQWRCYFCGDLGAVDTMQIERSEVVREKWFHRRDSLLFAWEILFFQKMMFRNCGCFFFRKSKFLCTW